MYVQQEPRLEYSRKLGPMISSYDDDDDDDDGGEALFPRLRISNDFDTATD